MNSQVRKVNGDLLFFIFLILVAIALTIGYGLLEIIDGLSIWIGKNMDVKDSASAFIISVSSFAAGVTVLVYIVIHAFRKSAQRKRQREFLEWNPDLDGATIRKTVAYMKRSTCYANIRFGTVGTALLSEFRSNVHPVSPNNTFAYEVFRVYMHFADPKSYPLPKSARPRK